MSGLQEKLKLPLSLVEMHGSDGMGYIHNDENIEVSCYGSFLLTKEENREFGQLVVTAVNAHEALKDALQAIVDWANFAQQHPEEFNAHGVKNLQGPVFDAAEAALKLARAET